MCHNQCESYVEFTQNPSVTHVTLDQCDLALGKNEMVIHTAQTSSGSRIIQTGRCQPQRWGRQPIVWSNSPENYMKIKEGVRSTGTLPLDPRMQTKFPDCKGENYTGIINTVLVAKPHSVSVIYTLMVYSRRAQPKPRQELGPRPEHWGGEGAINLFLVSAPVSVPASVGTPLQK